MRVLVIGGLSRSLVNFRGPLLEAMVAAGHEVHGCAGEVEEPAVEQLRQMGVAFHPVCIERRGTSVFGDRRYFTELKTVIGRCKPDVVLSYTIKPVIYGSLAAVAMDVPCIAAMITGAGAAQPGGSVAQRLVAHMARRLYRRALRHADVVFFQNPDDEQLFVERRLLGPCRVVQIAGSGVDTDHFAPAPLPTDPITFLMIARLLINKGVREYAAAAETIRRQHPGVRCVLVGPYEHGGGGVEPAEIERWQSQGVLEYVGATDDVRPWLAEASVYVLPSYREGTPRTVLEAMAMGRPTITTDTVGCRETVDDGVNGYLVPVRDAAALAAAMERFVADPSRIATMGRRSRDIAKSKYDVRGVNQTILSALGLS